MTFSDIFKSDFFDSLTELSTGDTVLALVFAVLVGLLIYFVYKNTFKGVMYSESFGVTLIALTLISTIVILAVSSNVVLSLGMVGALSIVRFRSAIKDPLDLAFLFWAIAAGIVLAAGLFPLAIIGSAVISVVMLIFIQRKPADDPYILVIACDNDRAEKAAENFVAARVRRFKIKSKTVAPGRIELNYEVRLKSGDTSFLNELAGTEGVQNTVLVSYNGDYMG